MSKVYIKTDDQSRIIEVNSDRFIYDISDYILIDEGEGDRFDHAQGNYLEKSLVNEKGCLNYKFIDGIIQETTQEEKNMELSHRPVQPPSMDERIASTEEAILFIMEVLG